MSVFLLFKSKKVYFATGGKMYYLTVENSFDSAHFLHGYEGKCSNLHGHRWRVVVDVACENLISEGQQRGMCVDFGDLKKDVKEITDFYDHAFIVEEGTLKEKTIEALNEENFRMIFVKFRPTAENFSKFFFEEVKKKGYNVSKVSVYETPNNCATYSE